MRTNKSKSSLPRSVMSTVKKYRAYGDAVIISKMLEGYTPAAVSKAIRTGEGNVELLKAIREFYEEKANAI